MSKMYDAITNLSDKIIEEAQENRLKSQKFHWVKPTALVACATFALGLGGMMFFHGGLGGATSGAGGTNGDTEGSSTFMSYEGPIFPMTLEREQEGITATRQLGLDFAPYIPYEESYSDSDGKIHTYMRNRNQIMVTDGYTLTNTTDSEQSLELIYPVVAELRSERGFLPIFTVDGEERESTLHFGAYSGDFVGISGCETDELFNLEYISDWTGYRDLLENGAYQQAAFEAHPTMDQAVIVYEFTDSQADFDQGSNPTLNACYQMDYEKTTVLSYGFNGGSFDAEGGIQQRHYSIPNANSSDYGYPRYLIVLGDDISNLTTQGYQNGGCALGEEIDSVTAQVARYETTLGQLMTTLATSYYETFLKDGVDGDLFALIDIEDFTGLCAQLLYSHGTLSEHLIARYDNGMLEDIISEVATLDRVIYSSVTLTIPAGERVEVTAQTIKKASYNYYGAGGDNDLQGYDMVTQLGSNLIMTEQTASIQTHDRVEIVKQNFGFDLEQDIDQVTLDPEMEHYYIEVVEIVED